MSVAVSNPKDRNDPEVKFRFSVIVEGLTVGWFTECNGLTLERETLSKNEGGVNDYVHQLPGRIKQSRITLKHGLTSNPSDSSSEKSLWNWFQEGLYDCMVKRRHVSIILYNSDRTKKKQWDLEKAYPVKWTGPDFQSDSNQVAIETLELVHHGLKMNDWTNNTGS